MTQWNECLWENLQKPHVLLWDSVSCWWRNGVGQFVDLPQFTCASELREEPIKEQWRHLKFKEIFEHDGGLGICDKIRIFYTVKFCERGTKSGPKLLVSSSLRSLTNPTDIEVKTKSNKSLIYENMITFPISNPWKSNKKQIRKLIEIMRENLPLIIAHNI